MTRTNKKLKLSRNTGTEHSVLVTLITRGRDGGAVSYGDIMDGLYCEYGDDLSSSYGNMKNAVSAVNKNILRPLGVEAISYNKGPGGSKLTTREKGFFLKRIER